MEKIKKEKLIAKSASANRIGSSLIQPPPPPLVPVNQIFNREIFRGGEKSPVRAGNFPSILEGSIEGLFWGAANRHGSVGKIDCQINFGGTALRKDH